MPDIAVFKRNIPTPTQMSPVPRRSSYLDGIAPGAPPWDTLCAAWTPCYNDCIVGHLIIPAEARDWKP
ncbi:hypothetical protein PHMEG_0006744 [Phytophthora megakarya]|uniref:Uncharacterized protein n=1 Tax=Phytophthora megakarya TaxID=4795 RepID=A0A225WPL4_9STRA|nr:hypothetical protein PHMEG_0006744 [Phytophthora megakarya]